jgi:hypothetical protein
MIFVATGAIREMSARALAREGRATEAAPMVAVSGDPRVSGRAMRGQGAFAAESVPAPTAGGPPAGATMRVG